MSRLSDSSRRGTVPLERRGVPRLVTDVAPLVALGVLFFSSDARFGFLDDEATMLNVAAQPIRTILAAIHPPLYALLLHIWLGLTGGAPTLLRAPSILFFLIGIWTLSRAASRIGGEESGTSMIWLSALWPFGFHYARLANGYSLSFLLIGALTWAYLRYAASPNLSTGAPVLALAVLLVWTTYFGWLLLALLACEEWKRSRMSEEQVARAATARLGIAAALLALASIPLWRTAIATARSAAGSHLRPAAALLNLAYSLYLLMVSESVAPWYWKFGVPAAIAVVSAVVLIVVAVRDQVRRFFLYAALSLALIAIVNEWNAERLLLVAPWFLLPAAVVIGTKHSSLWRRLIAVSLAIVAGTGWYGVVARVYYASPGFVEPWGDLAVASGNAVRDGGAVIGNDPSFFLYLTYGLRVPQATPWHFVGSLPTAVRYPQVWSAEDWQTAGHPLRPTVLWIAAVPQSRSMEEASHWLDQNCGDRITRRLVRDPGFVWKQRLLRQPAASPWLIEFRQYTCGDSSVATPPPAPPDPAPAKPR